MSHNAGTRSVIVVLGLVCTILFFTQSINAQPANNEMLDPSTQQSIEELNRLLVNGSESQIESKIRDIISNSGYISQLARVYYRRAQNEEIGNKVAQHYHAIIQNWPQSAWTQKAVIEFIPLYLMSDGEIGASVEETIWNQLSAIINPAADAPSIGEDPDMLVQEVHKQLMNLAYYRKNLNSLQTLQENSNQFNDQITLMMAFDAIENQQQQTAREQLNTWLQGNQSSPLAAVAYLGLFRCAETPQQRAEIATQLSQRFPKALETKLVTQQLR